MRRAERLRADRDLRSVADAVMGEGVVSMWGCGSGQCNVVERGWINGVVRR